MIQRKAMLVDITLCAGCNACQEACKGQNELPGGEEKALSATAYTALEIHDSDVAVTGMEGSSGIHYVPSLMEASITLSIITLGFIAFSLAAKHLPVFGREQPEGEAVPASWADELELATQTVIR